uniref:Protein LAZ1 homolog 1-like n=1 Tax=Nelumbo nucifera TaxID=4432 RepID=A0A822XUN5_NELNU|nr:TPA_asm: hypothetical protein HUJ06_024089 [Nelumbo nucifera]
MVPVYALESFLSLLNSEVAFICEMMRDCYEAFALYCFERYLIACLGGEDSTIKFMESSSKITLSSPLLEDAYYNRVVEHPFPMNCFLKQWYLGPDFYHAVKVGIVQYMILKMICALLAIILELFGVYGEGKFDWKYGYPYLAVVLNFSQTWALYCLVQFYSIIKEKLEPIKPLAKFLVFKSIVFLTWWQGVAVAFLFSMGVFKGSLAQELKTRIQDYIICIEVWTGPLFSPFPLFHLHESHFCTISVLPLACVFYGQFKEIYIIFSFLVYIDTQYYCWWFFFFVVYLKLLIIGIIENSTVINEYAGQGNSY